METGGNPGHVEGLHGVEVKRYHNNWDDLLIDVEMIGHILAFESASPVATLVDICGRPNQLCQDG